MKLGLKPARGVILAAAIVGIAAAPAQAQLRSALDTGEQATRRAEQAQERINQLDDERSDMVRDYRTILQRTDAAKLYAAQQEKVVESQRTELASLEDQLGRVDEITAQMIPMMLTMIDDLKNFVAADLPFKADERQEALNNLDTVMDKADVVPAEKYRLIIEAYQREMEYGNTVDTWEAIIPVEGGETTVQMFQYGRVALVYLTADKKKAARYNRETRTWDDLPGSYIASIDKAIKVAQGIAGQEVLYGPVSPFAVGQ